MKKMIATMPEDQVNIQNKRKRLTTEFFKRSPEVVARELLGKRLVANQSTQITTLNILLSFENIAIIYKPYAPNGTRPSKTTTS